MSAILSSSSGPTPSFYMPEVTLLAQTDVAVYQYDPTTQAVTALTGYQASNGAFQWYQASFISGEGSWWFPVAAVNMIPFQWNDTQYGGITDLISSGNGIWTSEGPNRMVRPATLYWWIPAQTLNQSFPLQPGSNESAPIGSFPVYGPNGKPQKTTVTQTDDQITVNIPPQSEPTTLTITQ